ncbi:exported alanine and valine rich protein [Mycolicibacterium cosmeticum]|uniref:Exported alanine and valine rich protein n=2 Tax=Mycolicibacterium cosmeticum TaxID=258533 RepID=W9AZD5_MYCCO|nr:exported alanine and valine rich protein [Mycolicibacterium cosmeticum]
MPDMLRAMAAMIAGLTAAMAFGLAPQASAAPKFTDAIAPIGNLGDTLHVRFGDFAADVTVHDVVPTDVPPGWGWNGSPRWRATGGPWKAPITVHVISAPNPYQLSISTTFSGVTPYADAYTAKHTDAPDALETALLNAPPGSTVNGAVYWDVYRGLVTNVVMLNPQTGTHLAQWNIWQPGTPLP